MQAKSNRGVLLAALIISFLGLTGFGSSADAARSFHTGIFDGSVYDHGDDEAFDRTADSRALNAATARYNAARESFPAVLFAGALGFQQADFHALTAEERPVMGSAPQVRFQ